ncbi:hypothetical protein SEVIR_5G171300v4 [Setaria viridis]|uniref:Uncharacterized protein n=1 Tax=Setaria viridis TaxID=4556 RepID=A0A4V6D6H9_SETVI|nr:hypothetical protein SEVIR_5G171300v2 [Setaria viridis]
MGHDLHPYGHFSCHRRLGAAPVLRIDVAPPLAFPLASPPHRLASTPAAPALGFRWHNRRRAGRRNSPPALGSPRQTMPPVSLYNELCLYWSVRCCIQLAIGRTHRVKNRAATVWYLTTSCCRFRRCSSSLRWSTLADRACH